MSQARVESVGRVVALVALTAWSGCGSPEERPDVDSEQADASTSMDASLDAPTSLEDTGVAVLDTGTSSTLDAVQTDAYSVVMVGDDVGRVRRDAFVVTDTPGVVLMDAAMSVDARRVDARGPDAPSSASSIVVTAPGSWGPCSGFGTPDPPVTLAPTCRTLSVADGTDIRTVVMRRWTTSGPRLGTLVLVHGRGGPLLNNAGGSELRDAALAQGLEIWEPTWTGMAEWIGPAGTGLPRSAARSAAVLRWVHGQVSSAGRLCALGHSAGSVELSLDLAFHGVDSFLTGAVLAGGPFHDFRDTCFESAPTPSNPAPAWLTECNGWRDNPAFTDECSSSMMPLSCPGPGDNVFDLAYGTGACGTAGFEAQLAADSPISAAADLTLASRVAFVEGACECGGLGMGARAYELALRDAGTATRFAVLPLTKHDVLMTSAMCGGGGVSNASRLISEIRWACNLP